MSAEKSSIKSDHQAQKKSTPIGVLFLFGETGPTDLKIKMQLSGGQLPPTA